MAEKDKARKERSAEKPKPYKSPHHWILTFEEESKYRF